MTTVTTLQTSAHTFSAAEGSTLYRAGRFLVHTARDAGGRITSLLVTSGVAPALPFDRQFEDSSSDPEWPVDCFQKRR